MPFVRSKPTDRERVAWYGENKSRDGSAADHELPIAFFLYYSVMVIFYPPSSAAIPDLANLQNDRTPGTERMGTHPKRAVLSAKKGTRRSSRRAPQFMNLADYLTPQERAKDLVKQKPNTLSGAEDAEAAAPKEKADDSVLDGDPNAWNSARHDALLHYQESASTAVRCLPQTSPASTPDLPLCKSCRRSGRRSRFSRIGLSTRWCSTTSSSRRATAMSSGTRHFSRATTSWPRTWQGLADLVQTRREQQVALGGCPTGFLMGIEKRLAANERFVEELISTDVAQ